MAFDDGQPPSASGGEDDDFLLREGLDLLASFRAIRSAEVRRALLTTIAAVAQAERDAASRALSDDGIGSFGNWPPTHR